MSYFHDCEADGVVPNRLDYYFSEGFTCPNCGADMRKEKTDDTDRP